MCQDFYYELLNKNMCLLKVVLLEYCNFEELEKPSPMEIRSYTLLDRQDKHLLKLLQENAKYTVQDLSDMIGLSKTPTFERIRKLEKEGFIQGYRAQLDREKMGFPLMAFCHVNLKEHSRPLLKKFEAQIAEHIEVLECYHLAGVYDYLLKLAVRDMQEYQLFMMEKLAVMDNVGNVQTSFALNTLVERAIEGRE
jgi:DNA-binding Lrp family transcriptional regulator